MFFLYFYFYSIYVCKLEETQPIYTIEIIIINKTHILNKINY